MIPISKIMDAKAQLSGIIQHTKLAFAPKLSQLSGAKVYLKQENLQNTGSFKLRGAFNKIASLTQDERAKGVIAASAGNHAQGVAYSAKYFGIKGVIVMPEATPLLKVMGVKELGAEAILKGNNYDEAYSYALEYAKKHALQFIHPFADDAVIAGQGTVALEMIEDQSHLTSIVVPIGGGGLIAGIAAAYKQMLPNVRIIGVVAEGAAGMYHSFYKKEIQTTASVRTIADGIAVRDVNPINFSYILESVDEIVKVDDEEIANAILYLLENQKLVVEGAGASVVAALLHNKFSLKHNESLGLVLSGGNIDVTMLGNIIEKGLVRSHRKMRFCVTLIDKPGSLQGLSNLLSQLGANIVKIDFDRTSTSFGDANVTVSLETKGKEHQDHIKAQLQANNYAFVEI
ncbi:threonine ammonia-lyase [Helicobacter winghamensis]|uniref:Threonine ammonia-lyase n=1 Tax=Helicobacter winghamensis TaxID=157268 RepID=A0A2N3PHI8_9HELI|nr:threonine ammonia-lyase [Helicobacter winghamensis]EEO26462.1 threonine ammonia-lyase [Helicobacter winghamensis ATCC BAA-430]PKT75481.1 threonine ammonia-lyase [Helicobacter winghamensis]PKT75649.1 threonine ammonia-lyase [Helicobacter winghamensis]PKT75858.1 threonine ammonia-lyase [Helicobacter winghamensis]PKT79946.1 threonine ammonia-lyase [Helicobacter winghamensis]